MSRSLSYLRRGLLGIALVGSLGFGATTAFAALDTTTRKPDWCADGTSYCYCLADCVMHGTCPC